MPAEELSPPEIPSDEAFWAWAADLEFASKDHGLIKLTDPWWTQREMVRQVLAGMRAGCRQFLVTKAGQVAGTTTASALFSYFILRCEGVQGVIVANEDEVREKVRQDVLSMTATANNSMPTTTSNATVVEWQNRAKAMMMTAGPKTGGRVGIGRGFALLLGTEVALWQNPTALSILRTRWSDVHPYRLAILETTARGRNWWWEVWEEAETAPDIARIELLWWMHKGYSLRVGSPEFAHYWDGRLTAKEAKADKKIQKRYDLELRPEQWAWRRMYVKTKAGGDEKTADQEMPSLIEDAFEATGISFLREDPIRQARRYVTTSAAPTRYRYEFGAHIEDTAVKRTVSRRATLQVWRPPSAVGGYVISAVPAHSTTMECDDWIVQVWEATRDTLEQVAEFHDDDDGIGMQPFAWVCAHLQWSFSVQRRAFILETMGLGQGVLDELRSLYAYGWGAQGRLRANDLGTPRNYIWRKPDSLTGMGSLQWRSSTEYLGWAMARLRDQMVSGAVIIRSKALLAEIERVRQDGDQFIAEGRTKANHRVVAAALATWSWSKNLVPMFQRVQGQSKATTVQGRMMEHFFARLGDRPTKNTMAGV